MSCYGKLESKVIVDARSLLSQFVMARAGERMGKSVIRRLCLTQVRRSAPTCPTWRLQRAEKLTAEAPAQIAKEAMTLLANAREAAKGSSRGAQRRLERSEASAMARRSERPSGVVPETR